MPDQTFFKKIIIDAKPQFLQCQQNNEGDLSLQMNNGETMFAGKCNLISFFFIIFKIQTIFVRKSLFFINS